MEYLVGQYNFASRSIAMEFLSKVIEGMEPRRIYGPGMDPYTILLPLIISSPVGLELIAKGVLGVVKRKKMGRPGFLVVPRFGDEIHFDLSAALGNPRNFQNEAILAFRDAVMPAYGEMAEAVRASGRQCNLCPLSLQTLDLRHDYIKETGEAFGDILDAYLKSRGFQLRDIITIWMPHGRKFANPQIAADFIDFWRPRAAFRLDI